MKLMMLGTGSILTSSLSACAVIDDSVLIDVPNGSVKAMRRAGLQPSRLNLCLITHFHGDHYFDLPFLLLELGLRQVRGHAFEVVGPVGLAERTHDLFQFAYPDSWERVVSSARVKFIELHGPGEVQVSPAGMHLEAIQVEHGGIEAYGFVVEWNGRRLGYTGDTGLCEAVRVLLDRTDVLVVDMSFTEPKAGHMSVRDVEQLALESGGRCRIVATHMTDGARSARASGIIVPEDGVVITV